MDEQTTQNAQSAMPEQLGAVVNETQNTEPDPSEAIPSQQPPEEQSQQTEARPEPSDQQADTLMSEAAVC